MSEIYETEIKSMTKEQNYMRGYKDGKTDVLDKIREEIKQEPINVSGYIMKHKVLNVINKYKLKSEDTYDYT